MYGNSRIADAIWQQDNNFPTKRPNSFEVLFAMLRKKEHIVHFPIDNRIARIFVSGNCWTAVARPAQQNQPVPE